MCFEAENLDIVGADVNGIIKKAVNDIKAADIGKSCHKAPVT